jgi:tripartite-type tricarboxylate transporter receptor subunit TctC
MVKAWLCGKRIQFPDAGQSFVALTIALASISAYGQQYPSKPVRVVVPFSPGGGTDFIARLLAPKLTAALGQQFIVDNRLGAGSTIGTEAALKSPADGYTLLLTSGSYTVAPSLYKLRYDPIRDMTPIVQPDDGPFIMVTHPSLPAQSVKQLVALAKSRPGEINYASSGVGSITHLSTELFSMVSAIRLTHVPYKGTGQSIADTIAGHNQLMLAAVASAIPQIKSARLRAIAVTSARRNPALPGVPTVMEAGYQYEVSNWHGLVGPKGMSRAIVEKLNSEINEVIKDPEFAQRIANDGLVPSGGPPERLLKLITDEMANWARVAEQAGLKAR